MIDFARHMNAATVADTTTPPPVIITPEAPAPEPVKVLSEEQAAVVEAVKSGRNVLVTGPAGTGKSLILGKLRELYRFRLPVAASTGIAAVQVSGVTLHSWAGLGLGDRPAKAIARTIIDNGGPAYRNIMEAQRLALDEVSMISASLMDKVDEIFKIIRKSEKPFGGIQMIMFGDFLQLPPVIKGTDEEKEKDGFCFISRAWRAADIRVAVLTKIFRQSDEGFAEALRSIRLGVVSPVASAILNSRYRVEDTAPEIKPVTIHTHNVDVDDINARELEKVDAPVKEYIASEDGKKGPLALLQKNCLAPFILQLKPGAQVMLLTNLDTAAGLANGSVGKVVAFHKMMGGTVEVNFANGQTRFIERHTFEIEENGRSVAQRIQFPLRLAYAITTHKSQGMTLDKIEVYLGKVFEYGQAYVALSRVKTKEGLFIQSGSKKAIMAHPEALEFYENCSRI